MTREQELVEALVYAHADLTTAILESESCLER